MLVEETYRQFRSFPVLKERLKIGVLGRDDYVLRVSGGRFQVSDDFSYFSFVETENPERREVANLQCCSLHLYQSLPFETKQMVQEMARPSLKASLLEVCLSWPKPLLLEVVGDCYCILHSNSLSSLETSKYASAHKLRHRLTCYIVQCAIPFQAR